MLQHRWLRVVVLLALVGLPPDACADWVYLKDGRALQGEVRHEGDGRVVVLMGAEQVILREDEIARIVPEEGTPPAPPPAPPAPSPGAPEAPPPPAEAWPPAPPAGTCWASPLHARLLALLREHGATPITSPEGKGYFRLPLERPRVQALAAEVVTVIDSGRLGDLEVSPRGYQMLAYLAGLCSNGLFDAYLVAHEQAYLSRPQPTLAEGDPIAVEGLIHAVDASGCSHLTFPGPDGFEQHGRFTCEGASYTGAGAAVIVGTITGRVQSVTDEGFVKPIWKIQGEPLYFQLEDAFLTALSTGTATAGAAPVDLASFSCHGLHLLTATPAQLAQALPRGAREPFWVVGDRRVIEYLSLGLSFQFAYLEEQYVLVELVVGPEYGGPLHPFPGDFRQADAAKVQELLGPPTIASPEALIYQNAMLTGLDVILELAEDRVVGVRITSRL